MLHPPRYRGMAPVRSLATTDSSGFRIKEGFVRPRAAVASNPCVPEALGSRVPRERPGQTREGIRCDGVLVAASAKVRQGVAAGLPKGICIRFACCRQFRLATAVSDDFFVNAFYAPSEHIPPAGVSI